MSTRRIKRRYSTERFLVYRERPFKVLYMEGKGFLEPEPSLHAEAKRSRHIWWFVDKRVAQAVARATTATDPDRPCYVMDGVSFARWRMTNYPLELPSPCPMRAKAQTLEDLL